MIVAARRSGPALTKLKNDSSRPSRRRGRRRQNGRKRGQTGHFYRRVIRLSSRPFPIPHVAPFPPNTNTLEHSNASLPSLPPARTFSSLHTLTPSRSQCLPSSSISPSLLPSPRSSSFPSSVLPLFPSHFLL